MGEGWDGDASQLNGLSASGGMPPGAAQGRRPSNPNPGWDGAGGYGAGGDSCASSYGSDGGGSCSLRAAGERAAADMLWGQTGLPSSGASGAGAAAGSGPIPQSSSALSLESASLRAAAENLWGQTRSPPPVGPNLSGAPALPSMHDKEADAMRAAAGQLWLTGSGASTPAPVESAADLPYGGADAADASILSQAASASIDGLLSDGADAGTSDLLAQLQLDAGSQPLPGMPP